MKFGVNLNNREPLITSDYTLADLLDLAELAEQRGFGSVWVGDSLFSKPRFEPISLLSAISQRTSRAKLGTACLVTSTRNPLYLALEWATLDRLSGGRRSRRLHGQPGTRRPAGFRGARPAVRQARGGLRGGPGRAAVAVDDRKVTHHGEYYDFDEVSFYRAPRWGR